MYRAQYLAVVAMLAMSSVSHAASSSCPSRYSDEQTNLIKHLAAVGAAGEFCPNLERNLEPFLGYLALAWNGFRASEMECDLWAKVYDDAEKQAGLQIAANGLKPFCETSIRLYGPKGSLVQGGLTFDAGAP
ncbi:hypothetical protein [Pleomorphomonas sp. NRK KF1]|uniref:hypothetical protein n=1 Tax=Pleomorphomonas sp. NRK KF1 TaxID=2943000 RepID=UPI002042DBBC|nr:hypothetical protein [Pleomorphomonas sp. NRK KF1]MCM5552074.1 hypothetical protein [Pleomorphomonas sp. NRK KF1]